MSSVASGTEAGDGVRGGGGLGGGAGGGGPQPSRCPSSVTLTPEEHSRSSKVSKFLLYCISIPSSVFIQLLVNVHREIFVLTDV